MKRMPPSTKVAIGEPGDHRHLPGTISIHVIYGEATCNGSVPLDVVASAVADSSRYFAGRDLTKTRDGMRTGILEMMNDNAHMTRIGANSIIGAALWLAWTASDKDMREYLQEAFREEGRLVLILSQHSVHGRPAINGRTLWFRPDAPWEEIIAAVGTGLSAEEMTRQLAPH